jgi:hypothetical protein
MMTQSQRLVSVSAFMLLIMCAQLVFTSRSSAQTGLNVTGASNCTLADFDASVAFVNGPGDTFTVVIDKRNIANHTCVFDGPLYGPSLVPDRVEGELPFKICYQCDKSATNDQNSAKRPLILDPDNVARQTFRWKTMPSTAGIGCVHLHWMAGPLLLVTPSLLKPVCSDIDVSGFSLAASPGNGGTAGVDKVPAFALASSKSKYYERENFALHVVVAQPDSLSRSSQEGCPKLYLRERSPDGATRVDEVQPLAFKGCGAHAHGHQPGDWASGFELDSGANSKWMGNGQFAFEVSLMAGSLDDPQLRFSSSNVLRVQVADPATIDREWGLREKGIAADINLDKHTFRVGEDVALHLAIENFDATVPIFGPDPLWDPCFVVGIEVDDATGHPLSPDNRFNQRSVCLGGHGFPPILYEKGKIVPLERSLGEEGWLPNHPGTYTILVTWAPCVAAQSDSAHARPVTDLKCYAIARATSTIDIVSIDTPASK